MSWLFYVSLGSALLGVALAVLARRRLSRGRHPACRKCDFDLTGLPAVSSPPGGEVAHARKCPECGSDLSAPNAVIRGLRARRRGVQVIAALLFLMGCAGLWREINRTFVAQGWEHRAPGWWLAKVEMRYSRGDRLFQAMLGLQFNTGRRFRQQQIDDAYAIGFRRFFIGNFVASGAESQVLSVTRQHVLDHGGVASADVAKVLRADAQLSHPSRPGPAPRARVPYNIGRWAFSWSARRPDRPGADSLVAHGDQGHRESVYQDPVPDVLVWDLQIVGPDGYTLKWTQQTSP